MRRFTAIAALTLFCGCASTLALVPYRVVADGVPAPLDGLRGDPVAGRAVIAGRDANCLLCHAVAETGERFMGDLGPPLSGIGARYTAAQLRLRIIDSSRFNTETVMPSYYRIDGLHRVAENLRGKPILTAQQVEDVVAYLETLRP